MCTFWCLCYEMVIPLTGQNSLGEVPPASSIAGLKLPKFGGHSGVAAVPSSKDDKESSEVKSSTSGVTPAPFTLGELPAVPGRLVQKIQRGDFVDMAELLRDNMELECRRAAHETPVSNIGLGIQPSHHEVQCTRPNILGTVFWCVRCGGKRQASRPISTTPRVPDHDSSRGETVWWARMAVV